MGTVFQIINQRVEMPGIRRRRVWLEPGCPTVLWPGLIGLLTIDRIDDRYAQHLQVGPHGAPRYAYKFWSLVRAVRLNEQMNPVAVLVEVSTDQKVSEPGLQA